MGSEKILVMVPLSVSQAEQLLAAGSFSEPTTAVAATNGLIDTFGIDLASADSQEEAELAALQIAGVVALTTHGARLVASALVNSEQWAPTPDDPNGLGVLSGVQRGQLRAFFIDEQGPDEQLASELSGLDIEQAWTMAADFMAAHDLLWHAPEELERVLKSRNDA